MTTDEKIIADFDLVKDSATPYAMWFTGWKPCDPDYLQRTLTNTWKAGDKPDDSFGYVGQLVKIIKVGESPMDVVGAYVNLPGMETGVFPPGGTMDIGTARLYHAPTAREMHEMLVSGITLLRKTVAEYKERSRTDGE